MSDGSVNNRLDETRAINDNDKSSFGNVYTVIVKMKILYNNI